MSQEMLSHSLHCRKVELYDLVPCALDGPGAVCIVGVVVWVVWAEEFTFRFGQFTTTFQIFTNKKKKEKVHKQT